MASRTKNTFNAFSSEFIANLIRGIIGFLRFRFNNVNYWPSYEIPYFSISFIDSLKLTKWKGKKYWSIAVKPSINRIKKHRYLLEPCFFSIGSCSLFQPRIEMKRGEKGGGDRKENNGHSMYMNERAATIQPEASKARKSFVVTSF